MSNLFKECPFCGAHLDHGERCDCVETARITPPERAYIGVDLAQGRDFTVHGPEIIVKRKSPDA